MASQAEKGRIFRGLHERAGAFVIPNPWDVGSARLLAGLGFEALATTSSGFARSIGKPDHGVSRDEAIAHSRIISSSVDLPVSGDLENGFGDAPEDAARTIREAAEAGLVGGSIEDSTGRKESPQYEIAHAAARVRAAVEAARSLGFPFTLTARAENFTSGVPDLADAIRRLQAYQEAGADVLFAPLLRSVEDIRSVIASVDRPVNVLQGRNFISVSDLSAIGVKRISVGGMLANAAVGALLRAARELIGPGTFTFASSVAAGREIDELIAGGAAKKSG
jgi:2-methylisocitrate lyase-like PEP mutase family enzyme